ncbi:hypothetical protein Emtol_2761 [Emticicia oligotrophica DSM 17448]|uniref:Secretion system C-terminal sorting domain-containing protein n=1 Tax=Emticicia oligotrophica (strain DSM 17448 / CIP 109782 / MTCC 6937 / GPTSA100-15) TaxID=929562 RepID=A0ABM5N355_EMTOG|nr:MULTISPECIES: DUF3244 domain-containing protein [Emticicia]AFK03896.1 hypothetical protein Emtol_2761 [Emticicia oligotrophica DSM 17448]
MKTQFKNFAVALVAGIFSFSSVLANSPIEKNDESKTATKRSFNVGMYRIINSMKVNVLVDKQDSKALDISVKNEQNEVVYSEVVGKNINKFSKKLDLSGLKDGKYRIEISNGKETVTKQVNVETHAPIPSEYRSVEVK